MPRSIPFPAKCHRRDVGVELLWMIWWRSCRWKHHHLPDPRAPETRKHHFQCLLSTSLLGSRARQWCHRQSSQHSNGNTDAEIFVLVYEKIFHVEVIPVEKTELIAHLATFTDGKFTFQGPPTPNSERRTQPLLLRIISSGRYSREIKNIFTSADCSQGAPLVCWGAKWGGKPCPPKMPRSVTDSDSGECCFVEEKHLGKLTILLPTLRNQSEFSTSSTNVFKFYDPINEKVSKLKVVSCADSIWFDNWKLQILKNTRLVTRFESVAKHALPLDSSGFLKQWSPCIILNRTLRATKTLSRRTETW